jgi:UDP:flavonoid glycosyltransferase YjiC (YdhE family)
MRNGGSQATVILTCEVRDDLGFGAPLLCMADELVLLAEQRGCELRTIFVLNDPIYYGDEISSHGHMALPGPWIKRPFEINSLAKSHASLLAGIGFSNERELNLIVDAWDRLFALLSPDVLIADNSPAACVAARGRIPTFVTGSGFSTPPAHMAVFPSLAKGIQPETNQALILDVVNKVLQRRAAPLVENLPQLFAGDHRAVFTVPQLDPYGAYRNERLFSPCINGGGPLPTCEAPSIFFSMPSTFPQLIEVTRTLERLGAAVSCYVPGPRSVGLTLLTENGARVFDRRPILTDVLLGVRVVLTASADLALAAFLAGRPQLVLPTDLETRLMASELEKRHTAISLELYDTDQLQFAIGELLNNSSYIQSSQEEARRAHPFAVSGSSLTSAATECLELVTSS